MRGTAHRASLHSRKDVCMVKPSLNLCFTERKRLRFGDSCRVDDWYYFHNIDSEGVLPEEVDEVWTKQTNT